MTDHRVHTSSSTAALAWAALMLLIMAVPMISLAGPAAAADGGGTAPSKGEQIFTEQKCSTCHALSSMGVEAKVKEGSATYGGDLSGAVSEDEIDALGPYLRGETERDGANHKKKVKLSDAEMKALLGWLAKQ